jgi:AcrR family transcriptional regulator
MTPAAPASATRRMAADDRRRQLIETAVRLFARTGFSGTTTREIAHAAGVNEALIFRFFPHKDDLYAAILEHKSAEARTDALVDDLSAAAAAGDVERVIRTVVTHVVEHSQRDPQFLRLMLHSSLEDHSFAREYRERHLAPLRRFLVGFVVEEQRQGRFRAGDPEALARAILAVPIHHVLVETLQPDPDLRVGDEWIDLYASFILAGLQGGPASSSRSSE